MSNSGRSRVREDRFYSPPAMRRYNQQHQQPEVQQEKKQVQPQQQQEKQEQSESLMNSSSATNSNVVMSNLDRFMKHTTPIVTAQHFPKTSMKGRRNHENCQPYFILGDLWESFKEWSAYGAGVPLVLNESDSVVQYYAPYLSAIQLYVDPSAPVTSIRRPGEGSDSESSSATISDGIDEAGAVGCAPRVLENNVDSTAQCFNTLMLDEGEIRNPPGLLLFEYFEHSLPYHRAPLADQVSELASRFPLLKTYQSCDLTQSSWLSVAWYPIYRIPVGPSLQNVDTCFLTFHSLSTPLRDGDSSCVRGSTVREVHDAGMPCCLSLPIFGLSVYKFKSSDWTRDAVHGIEKVNSLIHSTENWLRSLGIYHPDFVFFKNRAILR